MTATALTTQIQYNIVTHYLVVTHPSEFDEGWHTEDTICLLRRKTLDQILNRNDVLDTNMVLLFTDDCPFTLDI